MEFIFKCSLFQVGFLWKLAGSNILFSLGVGAALYCIRYTYRFFLIRWHRRRFEQAARITAAAREGALLERAEANLRRLQQGRPDDVVLEMGALQDPVAEAQEEVEEFHDVEELPDVEEAAAAFEAEVRALADARRRSLRSYKS